MQESQGSDLENFIQGLQKTILPGVWSKGVSLARANAVQVDNQSAEEITLRVKTPEKPVSSKVQLWPVEDDYFCDCDERTTPCSHVAASVAALRNGKAFNTANGEPVDLQAIESAAAENAPTQESAGETSSDLSGDSTNASGPESTNADGSPAAPVVRRLIPMAPKAAPPPLAYELRTTGNSEPKTLLLERKVYGETLKESLISLFGGIQSGRVQMEKPAVTKDDFAIDDVLDKTGSPNISLKNAEKIFPLLRTIPGGLKLDGRPIRIGHSIQPIGAEVVEEGSGFFRIRAMEDVRVDTLFDGGMAIANGTLHFLEDPNLSDEEKKLLIPPGRKFSPAELQRLVTEIVPQLREKITVYTASKNYPTATLGDPEVLIELDRIGEDNLRVIPTIRYPSQFSIRAPDREAELARALLEEKHLNLGQSLQLNRSESLQLMAILQRPSKYPFRMKGTDAINHFIPQVSAPKLISRIDDGTPTFEFSFRTPQGKEGPSVASVFKAWKDGDTEIPLLTGGFMKLPIDWLEKYGARVERLLFWKNEGKGALPKHFLPELVSLTEESGGDISESLNRFKEELKTGGVKLKAKLPKDLTAELRHYQTEGVQWLTLLRESGMGALLADDMGLGKTLQALCAARGHTLIVCPTSVLTSWTDQIAKFRPGTKFFPYLGSKRTLEPSFAAKFSITLTTYALLRIDRELLAAREWDTIILDEAQTIKNPDAQITRAAHALRGKFRLNLSGTPVENRLDDLWSQFQFLNPGLLGTMSEFKERYAGPIGKGDINTAALLQKAIRPFILRRLKKEVAPELPPRTEVVLECTLSENERNLYDALLAASKKEVLAKLDAGESVFSALELLLRLRQASCHPALLPGEKPDGATSAKVELLIDQLEETIAEGHRSLIFSQWTSFLDLIEPALNAKGITFCRLDGSTKDRQGVVKQFQDPNGPSVMLLSLKAGGTGLTLTAADHVFLMDSWWNPAVEDQAADRVHRIGQENPVLISRLIAKDTVEEKILQLQKSKLNLASSILDGGAASASLTREDILNLLT